MADLPLVSIVTPSLNQGQFIEATIESVLSQDYPRIEYIVMDGGSTDGTLEILRRYGPRLQWVSEPDRGQSHAINKGFRRARGQILAWLNSDDTYLPGAVTASVEHFLQHPDCGMVYGEGFLIDERGEVITRFPATQPFNLWKLVYVIDYILQQTAFFRREVLDAVGGLDEQLHFGMDWDLFIRIGKRFRVDYLPIMMANLREYAAAKTLSGGRTRFRELVTLMRRHGARKFPPAYLAYGLDTYYRLAFDALESGMPGPLLGPVRRARRLAQRPTHGAIRRLLRQSQGLYPDGWVAAKSHFLIPRAPGADTLVIRGARPPSRWSRAFRLAPTAHGTRLGVRRVESGGDFEVRWPLPSTLRGPDALDVEITCRPTFTHRRATSGRDRRRLGFQLKAVSIE